MAPNKTRKRSRQRGAAMVEGAIVVSVMVVFSLAMTIAYSAGKAKLMAQQDARVELFYYASNDCAKQIPGAEIAAMDRSPAGRFDGTDDGAVNDIADRAPLGSQQFSARSEFFFASQKAEATVTHMGHVEKKQSSSWMVCNEKPEDGTPSGLLHYAGDLFSGILPSQVRP
jgi:hypothetical protein